MKPLVLFMLAVSPLLVVGQASNNITPSTGALTPTPEQLYWYEYTPPPGVNVNGCTFNWLPTNGQAVVTTDDGTSAGSTSDQRVYLKWLNNILNDGSNIKVSVSVTGCVTTNLDGIEDLPVNPKYLPLPVFKTSGGSTITTLNVPCYVPEITLRLASIPDAEYYRWELPAGWSKKGSPGVNLFSTTTPTVDVTVGQGVTSTSIKAYTSIASFNGPSTTLPVTRNPDQIAFTGTNPTVYCSSIVPVTYQVTSISGISYNWTYPSGWICQSGCTSNTITLVPNGSNVQGQSVTARGSVVCSGQAIQTNIASQVIAFSTAASPDMTVSGSQLICTSNTTFTLANVASGAPVTWQATPSNLFAVSSGTGTTATVRAVNSSVKGQANITFTIQCGSVPQVVPPKTVWVGSPDMGASYISGATTTSCNIPYTYQFWGGAAGALSMTWQASNHFTLGVNGLNATLTPTKYGEGYLSMKASNTCGSTYTCLTVCATGCDFGLLLFPNHPCATFENCGFSLMSVYPNPTQESLTVKLSDDLDFKAGEEYMIVIIDETGNTAFSGVGDTKEFIIKKGELKPGRYIIRCTSNGKTILNQRLIVK